MGARPRTGYPGRKIPATFCVYSEVLKLVSLAGKNQGGFSPQVVDLGSVLQCLETVIRHIVCHP